VSTRTSLASRNSRVGTCARSLWWFGALLPLFAFAAPAHGYNCGGREFRLVAVSVWPTEAGASADYSIVAQMPGLSGCEILVDTVITIQFPRDTDTSTVSGGIVNGATIAKWVARSGPFLSFRSPIEVDSSGLLSLQVWGVTNDSTPGTKTLTMSASPVRSGRIGATTSSLFTLRPPLVGSGSHAHSDIAPRPLQSAKHHQLVHPRRWKAHLQLYVRVASLGCGAPGFQRATA